MPSIRINKETAATLLRAEAREAERGEVDTDWERKIERLSQLCADGLSKTHIAFLGTSILAKAVDCNVDLYAIKPTAAPQNSRAYSARPLCESVLVPLAAELGIHIGVTGRQPLNNQPYFRMQHLGDDTPVHPGGQQAFNYMLELIGELDGYKTTHGARSALRAFIAVRRRYQPRYTVADGEVAVTPERLTEIIKTFVRQDSENGRRAQAVVAGLVDVFAGADRVESGRINDPSRKYPGDVCVCSPDSSRWEKAIEVRDKPVHAHDVQIFGQKCVNMGVLDASVVMVATHQPDLDESYLKEWASGYGLGLTLYSGWENLVDQVLFWASTPKPEAALLAVAHIEKRLISVEVTAEAVSLWQSLVRGQ